MESFLDGTALIVTDTAGASAGSAHELASLRVRSGIDGPQRLPVLQADASVGSDASNDVVIAGEGIAARHAALRLRGGFWTLSAADGADQTWVDDAPATGEVFLAPGSVIRLGSVVLAFAPSDRWADSPPERRAVVRAPLLVLPSSGRSWWPMALIGAVFVAIAAVALFLLRTG